ncbi:unnamed protein product [Caenorhabditis angaria]|uniref:Uncharacterized protein n=1 Tax=Caenorhabditis angaria TaxID=860376 RepID=A0A9P1MXJ0_9PELO|nr:unnamed protein product [Caenorhabditis angaria]
MLSFDEMTKKIDLLESEFFKICLVIPILIITILLLILILFRIMFCCTRSQRKRAVEKLGSLRKHDSGPMFARLEEFDILTPLQPLTPDSTVILKNYGSASSSSVSPLFSVHSSSSSDSPPPPRRSNNGKTLIVPLNASRYRNPMVMTPSGLDSRLTSLDGATTTKSCATIPEDDEDETEDLLSIDRTSVSFYEPGNRLYSGYNLCLPQPAPEFQSTSSGFSPMLPAPTYSPPSLPSESPATKPESPNSSSSQSLTDSFYMNNFDGISSNFSGSQLFDEESSEIAIKFQLHRIEEESEVSETCEFVPRSISQQFDMMRQQSENNV